MTYAVDTTTKTLSADWGQGNTVTIDYPAGRTGADYAGSAGHKVFARSIPVLEGQHVDFHFGPTNITITNRASQATAAAGEVLYVHLHRSGMDIGRPAPLSSRMAEVRVFKVCFGEVAADDANGVVESQACTAAGGLATGINGTLATDGVATFDVPRNVVASWTGTAVLTVTGTDEFGNAVVESSGSGASFTGKKAFKTITGVAVSSDVTALTVGSGDVLGLPVFLESAADIIAEYEDGAAASAGTIVAGSRATPTATTGDVRGTYSPNTNPNGETFEILLATKGAADIGLPQFAG